MLWIKAFHVIFMVTWFAGLFYLPRLFVYHAQCEDTPGRERFKVMQHRLFFIMSVGAVGTFIFGLWLLFGYSWSVLPESGWLHAKLALVALLAAYHIYCRKLILDFRHERNRRGPAFYRWFNEFPTLILVAVVILAVVKPV